MEMHKTEIISLMMRMRLLIKREFGVAPSLRDGDAAMRYYELREQSTQPELLHLTGQLGAYLSSSSTDAATPAVAVEPSSPPVVPARVEPHHTATRPDAATQTLYQQPESFVEILASDLLNYASKLTHPIIDNIVIDKKNQQYYAKCTMQDIFLLDALSTGNVGITPIDAVEIQRIYPDKSPLPLADLFWHCALNMSNGELLSQLKPYPLFRFYRWPKDFSMHWEQARLANFLSRPKSINALVEYMGVS